MTDGKALKVDSLFSFAYGALFDFVKFARKEEHWALTKEEATKLGKVSVGCLNTIPEATKAKVIKRFDKYLPWVSLVGFALVITYPRVQTSISIENEKKRTRFPNNRVPFPANDPVSRPARKESTFLDGTPRVPTEAATVGVSESSGTSFPPGSSANVPPLDYQIS